MESFVCTIENFGLVLGCPFKPTYKWTAVLHSFVELFVFGKPDLVHLLQVKRVEWSIMAVH